MKRPLGIWNRSMCLGIFFKSWNNCSSVNLEVLFNRLLRKSRMTSGIGKGKQKPTRPVKVIHALTLPRDCCVLGNSGTVCRGGVLGNSWLFPRVCQATCYELLHDAVFSSGSLVILIGRKILGLFAQTLAFLWDRLPRGFVCCSEVLFWSCVATYTAARLQNTACILFLAFQDVCLPC